jgi:hypothetical protein
MLGAAMGSARRRRGYRRTVLGLIGALVAVVLSLVVIAFREDPWIDDAFAAPAKGKSVDAGPAPPDPEQVTALASGGGDSGVGEAIDFATAPDGGVPRPPDGGAYRSPFSKPGAPLVRAKVAILLNSIDDYDIKTGTFTADFFLSLTSHEPMPAINLVGSNGKLDEAKEVIADKPTFKLYRLSGKFKSPPSLRQYPFDAQSLKIVLEDDVHGIDQLRFSVDKERVQLARGFRAMGWTVTSVDGRTLSQSYPDRFEGDDLYYSRLIFTVNLDRFATSAAFKVFVPAFVIVVIALLGMWVPPNEMEVRSNAGAPMLAGAVLFHFALMQELPSTSYLTRADKVMLGVYISLALGMISTWWMFVVEERNIEKVFRIARVAVPVLTAVTMAVACLL